MMLSQWGYRNCVAISGDDLSEWQVNMIKELGNEIQIVIALDKDKGINDVKNKLLNLVGPEASMHYGTRITYLRR